MHIPLSELTIAKVNVRQATRKADYADLIPSIRERGILQPLLVRKNGKGFEIVAGRRRYLAALSLEKDGLEVEAVPCAVMAKGDDAAAVEASLIENVAHLPMDEMDQFEAFNRLLKEGRSIEAIANTFGVTEITVKRRLAIANLLPKIRQLYRNEEIDPETLRALTLATKPQQKDWLALFDDAEQHAPTGHEVPLHARFGWLRDCHERAVVGKRGAASQLARRPLQRGCRRLDDLSARRAEAVRRNAHAWPRRHGDGATRAAEVRLT